MDKPSEIPENEREIIQLKAGDHLCSIYRNQDEQMRVVVPFLINGLDNNEKCIYIMDESSRKDVLDAFQRYGVELKTHINSGRFSILDKNETYLKDGTFDPDRMIATLREAETEALKEGHSGLRVTGEMTWVFTALPGTERFIEYEAKLNDFFPQSRASAICQYHEPRFKPAILIDVIHTHPHVVIYGEVCTNPYYLPPRELLLRMNKTALPLSLYEQMRDEALNRSRMRRAQRRAEAEKEKLLADSERSRRALLSAAEDLMLSAKELKLRDALLRIAGRLAKLGGWSVDLSDNRVLWSDEVADIHEMPRGHSPTVEEGIRFYAPEYRDRIAEVYADCARSGKPFDEELRILTAKGRRVWVRAMGEAEKDSSGRIVRVHGGFQDISERKEVEEALQESREYLKAVLDSVRDAIFVDDAETGRIIDVNQGMCDMYGYSREEALRTPIGELSQGEPPFSHTDALEHLRRAREQRPRRFEWLAKHKDGRLFWVEVDIRFTVIGGRDRFVVVARDISERKRAEDKIRESEETYRNLFQNAQVGLFRTRISDGKILESNEQLAKMFGYDNREEFIAEYMTSGNYVDAGTRERMLHEIKENGFIKNFEARFYRKDRSVFWASYSAKIYYDKGWIEGVAEDITDRKSFEERLNQKLDELRRWHAATLSREGRVLELKREVNELLARLGESPRYTSVLKDDSGPA